MAATVIAPTALRGDYDSSGNIDMTDMATGLVSYGSIGYHMLATPSLIRTELSNNEILITDDRRGTWSLIKAVRDRIKSFLTATEIVTNGTFAADTDWTKGTGWTIAAGVASSDGTQVTDALLTTTVDPVTVAALTYVVTFEVTAYTAGNVALQFDGSEVIADKAAVGVYSANVTASDTTGTIDIVADLDFIGSVDNVSLLQID